MPFSFDLLDQEQQKKKDQTEDGAQGAPAMTGGGDSFGGSSSAPQPGAPKGTSQQGSGFVNLDKYMTANQGNNFGGQFTGKVQGDVNQAKQTLDSSATGFTDASNKGTTRWNDVGDTVKGIVDNAGDKTSPDDVSKFQGYAGSKYQGPDNFSGSAYGTKAQGALQKGSQEAGALQSEGGRFALLDQFYGRPKYTTGEKSLDNLLVQNTPGVAARSAGIDNQAKQLTASSGQTTQNLDNLATANRAATQDASKQTQDYLGNAKTGFQTDLDKRFSDYNAGNTAYNQARQGDISDDSLDADTLGLYGLSEGQNLYNVNLGNYLNTTPTQADEGQFASDQDYAKSLALSQLAGEDPSYLTAENRAHAGSGAGMGRDTVDTARLNKDIGDSQTAFTSKNNDLSTQLKAAQDRAAVVQNAINVDSGAHPSGINMDTGEAMGSSTSNVAQAELNQLNQSIAQYKAQQAALANQYGVNRKVSKA